MPRICSNWFNRFSYLNGINFLKQNTNLFKIKMFLGFNDNFNNDVNDNNTLYLYQTSHFNENIKKVHFFIPASTFFEKRNKLYIIV